MLTCALCLRTLLPGELYRVYRGDRSREHLVCPLCEAEAAGLHWLRLDRPLRRVPVHSLSRTVRPAA